MNSPLKRTLCAGTGRRLSQDYDIIHTCDLMEFPLRSLARKIYFLLKAWRSRWPPPPELDKLIKFKIFTIGKFILLLQKYITAS